MPFDFSLKVGIAWRPSGAAASESSVCFAFKTVYEGCRAECQPIGQGMEQHTMLCSPMPRLLAVHTSSQDMVKYVQR
jgi:hypothetical protein